MDGSLEIRMDYVLLIIIIIGILVVIFGHRHFQQTCDGGVDISDGNVAHNALVLGYIEWFEWRGAGHG